MRKCSVCGLEKNAEEFSNHTYCKVCKSDYNKRHYNDNKQYYIDKAIKNKQKAIDFLKELKEVPCADCGNSYPYYVMDFDHLRDKEFQIGTRGRRVGREALLKEIDKCEVVCANCHRVRTHFRQDGPERTS